jgi:prepilin-type N-terminal cleavage/methylation domain-containing protein
MDFNPTSCVKRRRGFTLAEYLVATSIGLLVLAAALVLWGFASRTCASLLGYIDLSSNSKNALDRISQQIRNAKNVQSCNATQLMLVDPDGQKALIAFDPGAKALVRVKNSVRTTLLTECTNFQFSVFQRTPVSNSFQLFTNGWNTNTAKVIQMQWICHRRVTGDKSSVESQVAARVVIRNK